jgi:hypothetical protein
MKTLSLVLEKKPVETTGYLSGRSTVFERNKKTGYFLNIIFHLKLL